MADKHDGDNFIPAHDGEWKPSTLNELFTLRYVVRQTSHLLSPSVDR